MSNSKEVTFLAETFGIKLTDWKGSAVDTNSLSQKLGNVKARVEGEREKLQNLYIHPLIEDTDLQDLIRNTIRKDVINLFSDIETTRKYIAENNTNNLASIIETLEKRTTGLDSLVVDYNASLKKLEEEFKKKKEAVNKIQDLRNQLNTHYLASGTEIEKLEKVINGIDNPPDIRKEEYKGLKTTLEDLNNNVEARKEADFGDGISFKSLQFILPETLLNQPLAQLQLYEDALNSLIDAFKQISEQAKEAAGSWDGKVKDLFPSYILISSKFEDIFHEYEKFRAVILESKVSTEEEIQNTIKELDNSCLNILIDKENKTDSKLRDKNTENAEKSLKELKEKWKNAVSEREQARTKALSDLGQSQNMFKEYFPILLEISQVTEFDAKLAEMNAFISQAEYTKASTLAESFIKELPEKKTFVGGNELGFQEYLALHKEFKSKFPIEKIQAIGYEAQQTSENAELLGVNLPHSHAEIDKLLEQALSYYSDHLLIRNLTSYEEDLKEAQEKLEKNIEALEKHKDLKTDSGLGLKDIKAAKDTYTDKKQEKKDAKKELQAAKDEYQKALDTIQRSEDKLSQIDKAKIKAQDELKDPTLDDRAKKRAQRLIKALDKAKKETEAELHKNNKTAELSEANIKTKEANCEKIEKEMEKAKETFESSQQELSDKLLLETHPELRNIMAAWKKALENLDSHIQTCKRSLAKDNLSHFEEVIFADIEEGKRNAIRFWEQTEKTLHNEPTLQACVDQIDLLRESIDDEMNTLNDPSTKFGAKQQAVQVLKDNLFAQLTEIRRNFPLEENIPAALLPFTQKDTATEIETKLLTLSLDSEEQEEQCFKLVEQYKQELSTLNEQVEEVHKAVSNQIDKDLRQLIYFRDRLVLETKTRSEIANDTSAFMNSEIHYIRIAYAQLVEKLNKISDDYLRSIAETNMLPTQMKEFEALEAELYKIDSSDLQSLTNEYKHMEKDIENAQSTLYKAKKIKYIYPKNWEELDKKIGELAGVWKTQSIEKSTETLAKWKILFGEYEIQAEMMEGDIQSLVQRADLLRKQIKEKESTLASFPKTLAQFNDGLEKITESKIKTIDDYDANFPQYTKLQDLFEKMLLDPMMMQDQESTLSAQKDFDERQKKDWDAFLDMFRSKILPELNELIKNQKKSPNIDPKEKDSIAQYEKDSKSAFEAAKKSGKKGAYAEGRTQLKKIQGILTRLKRFPEGVNAQKLKSLKDISGKWSSALAGLKSQLDKLNAEIIKVIKEENNPELNETDIVNIINNFYKEFTKNNFDLAIMKLEAGEDLKKWKEIGLSQVRDYRALTTSPVGQKLMENPFLKIDWGAFNKTLNTIEKSFLLYKGA